MLDQIVLESGKIEDFCCNCDRRRRIHPSSRKYIREPWTSISLNRDIVDSGSCIQSAIYGRSDPAETVFVGYIFDLTIANLKILNLAFLQ